MSEQGGGGFFSGLLERSMRLGAPIAGGLFAVWMVAQLLAAFSWLFAVAIVGLAVWVGYRRYGG